MSDFIGSPPDYRLLQPSLSQDERCKALFAILWKIRDLDLSKIYVYDIDTVTNTALPILLNQFSAEEFIIPGLTEQQLRELIWEAINLHRRKGTNWAIEKALELVGSIGQVREWWQLFPAGIPHTFVLSFFEHENDPLKFADPDFWERMTALVEQMKPVRASFLVRQGIAAQTQSGMGSAYRNGMILESQPIGVPLNWGADLGVGAVNRNGIILELSVTGPNSITIPQGKSYSQLDSSEWNTLEFSDWALMEV